MKDSAILAKATSPEFRREWIGRILDHDGTGEKPGGLALWLALAEAVGLDRGEVEAQQAVLPEVIAACDEYVRFVESHDLLESEAASLTELFAGDIMRRRIEAFERHYPWVERAGLGYFDARTEQAPRDAQFGLAFVLEHARSDEDRARCLRALETKCEILWRLLDAIEEAHRGLRLVAHATLRFDAIEKRTLVVLPERAIGLNESAHELLARCDGRLCAERIALDTSRRSGEPGAYADVHGFLSHMRRLGVLETDA